MFAGGGSFRGLAVIAVLLITAGSLLLGSGPGKYLDSLSMDPDDKVRLRLYKRISTAYYYYDLDSAIFFGLKGLELAKEMSSKKDEASFTNNLGIFYQSRGLYMVAIEFYNDSYKIKAGLGDEKGMASTLNNLGSIYDELNNPDKALECYNSSLPVYRSLGDSAKVFTLLLNIAAAEFARGNYDKSMDVYQGTGGWLSKIRDESEIHRYYLNMGENYSVLGKPDSAISSFSKALELSSGGDNEYLQLRSCYYLGDFLLEKGSTAEAYTYLSMARDLAFKLESLINLRDVSARLGDYFRYVEVYDSAVYYLELYHKYKDMVASSDAAHQLEIINLTNDYERERSEAVQSFRQQRLMKNFYLLGLALILVISFFIYRSYRHKQKAHKLLAEMDRLKSRLFSNISHEFRTPLTLILGPLEQMMSDQGEMKPGRKTVAIMKRNANRLLTLVNQMLELSKLDAGSMKLELVEADIIKALKYLFSSFNSMAVQKSLKYDYKIPVGSHITWFDQDKLEKLISNLLSNAFKFTPPGGEVNCVARIHNDRLFVKVKDTGKGIPADQLEKVFDRFHQVEDPGDPDRLGTGIGLALVSELVNLMKGAIGVNSKQGQGSEFYFEIALGKEAYDDDEYYLGSETREDSPIENEVRDNKEAEVVIADSSMPLVLCVDDNEDIREHIKDNLATLYRIIEAPDGRAGLEQAREFVPDLVITDLIMPEMDGIELCEELKTDERTSHIPVVMLTAKAGVEDRITGIETGADAYLTKPFVLKELISIVKMLISQREKLRERFGRELKLEPAELAVTSVDEKFLSRLMGIIEERMSDPDLEVRDLQSEIGMSRMQLFRKLKALTNTSPSEFIRIARLKRAAGLMDQKFGNIAQITYEVGFNNLSYFSKCFKEYYGKSPSRYMRSDY